MRLKSLEIKGFKSFADKTLINLDNQITGIVGPNGCGKSNIVDAIRWVIGEHKIKTLRSDNLEDLIFNGSKTRNSSGLAEVSLTFENTKNLLPTEFNVVTISRKFYKNGESEYRLNDVTCRLKDITNLFMDTGVTSDSYSIIELGMVDDIIKDKENSRRRMLEQAAGISIYKTRKKEAKQKLDATEQDLNRIEDLLFEISNNLRSLESQAKKAEKYHSIKNEYKDVSVEFVKASLEDFNSTYQTLNTQQQHEVDAILALETVISKEGAALEARKLELTTREEELHQLQKTFNEQVGKLRSLENDKNLSAQKIQHLNELVRNIQNAILDSNNQTEILNKATTDAEKKLATEEDTLQKFKEKLETLRKDLDVKRTIYDEQKSEVDKLRNEHQQLQIHQFDAEKKVAVAENNINNLQRSITQQEEENKHRKTEIDKQGQNKEELAKSLELKKVTIAEMETKQNEATEKLLTSQALLEELRVQLFEENRKLDSKQNEYNLLKSLVDSLEGYPDSIKYLNKNAEWNQNAQLLSEVLNVKEEYRVCIEGYLDKYLNYYVVENPTQAYDAINLLKNHKKGKAGFFILSDLNEKTDKASTPENCISALDVISSDAKYAPVYQQLLCNVFIAENMEVSQSGNAVILQKDGTGYKTGKRILGGSVGIFEGNKIGRTQRLENLNKEIISLSENTKSFKEQISQTQNLIVGYNQEVKDDQIKKLRSEYSTAENTILQIEHRIENYNQQYETSSKRIEDLNKQLQETKDSIASTQNLHQEMQQQMSLAFGNLQQSQQKFTNAESDYNKSNEEYNQHNIILTRQQSRINEINNERNIRSQQIEDLNLKIIVFKKQLLENQQQLELTVVHLKEIEDKLHQALLEKEHFKKT